ncbi:MAG: hypothetical protein ACE5K0_08800 [Candidatus Methanofastidiosia archaeon]
MPQDSETILTITVVILCVAVVLILNLLVYRLKSKEVEVSRKEPEEKGKKENLKNLVLGFESQDEIELEESTLILNKAQINTMNRAWKRFFKEMDEFLSELENFDESKRENYLERYKKFKRFYITSIQNYGKYLKMKVLNEAYQKLLECKRILGI